MLTDEYSRTSGEETPCTNVRSLELEKIRKLKESIIFLSPILFLDLVCLFIIPKILLSLNNVFTLMMFTFLVLVNVLVLRKFSSPLDTIKMQSWLKLSLLLSILFLLVTICNYFYMIYDKILKNFFSMINLYEGGEIVMGIFYVSVLLYGTMNIFAPVWMIHEIRRVRKFIENCENKINESQNKVELVNLKIKTDV